MRFKPVRGKCQRATRKNALGPGVRLRRGGPFRLSCTIPAPRPPSPRRHRQAAFRSSAAHVPLPRLRTFNSASVPCPGGAVASWETPVAPQNWPIYLQRPAARSRCRGLTPAEPAATSPARCVNSCFCGFEVKRPYRSTITGFPCTSSPGENARRKKAVRRHSTRWACLVHNRREPRPRRDRDTVRERVPERRRYLLERPDS